MYCLPVREHANSYTRAAAVSPGLVMFLPLALSTTQVARVRTKVSRWARGRRTAATCRC
jgi:hypothetical protein